MIEKKDVVAYCLTFREVYEDYPFHDPNWCVMRHKGNRKVFAWISIPACQAIAFFYHPPYFLLWHTPVQDNGVPMLLI